MAKQIETQKLQTAMQEYKKSLEAPLKNMVKAACYELLRLKFSQLSKLQQQDSAKACSIIQNLDLSNVEIGEIKVFILNSLSEIDMELTNRIKHFKFNSDMDFGLLESKIEAIGNLHDCIATQNYQNFNPRLLTVLKERRNQHNFSSSFWAIVDKFFELVGLEKSTMGITGAKISNQCATFFQPESATKFNGPDQPNDIVKI